MDVFKIFRFIRFAHFVGTVLPVTSFTVQFKNGGDWVVNDGFDQAKTSRSRRPYKQWLHNELDVGYTANVTVGNKKFQAILDTGSFDLHIFSTDCKGCGARQDLYHAIAREKSEQKGVTSFGSGILYSDLVKDHIIIGPLYSRALDFWAVTRAEMPVLDSKPPFQAIFGLAPPSGALKIAELQAEQVRHRYDTVVAQTGVVSPDLQDLVDRHEGVLKHAKESTPFMKTISLTSFSTCFHKQSKSPGYHFWHDTAVQEQRDRFVSVPVVGSAFWSSVLTDVRFRMETLGELSGKTPTNSSHKSIGCAKQACRAVFDTGSSLIAAPPDQAIEVYRLVYDWLARGGTCDDLSSLPELEFVIGGVTLTLPPESYVGIAEDEFSSDVRRLFAQFSVHNWKRMHGKRCMPLLMPVVQEVDDSDIWIFGVPFFRKYYTNFALSESQVATTMSFSVADENCQPGSSPGVAALRFGAEKMQKRSSQMRVHAPSLRLPSMISRTRFFSEAHN